MSESRFVGFATTVKEVLRPSLRKYLGSGRRPSRWLDNRTSVVVEDPPDG
ncbi:MAG: hypothetical protein JJT94_03680 [Bernardetiaceae bacterium]|nr:hypothetical protein [Bernardetiaceae bacterium]